MANFCENDEDYLSGDCSLDVAGLAAIYLVNANDIASYTVDVLTGKELIGLVLKDGKRAYKFEFKFNSAKFMAELLVNGTTRNIRHAVEFQTSVFATARDILTIEKLATAKLVALVEDRAGKKYMLGTPKSYLKAQTLTIDSGAAEEDASNITANISGIVAAMPLIIDDSIILEDLMIPVGTPAVPVLVAPTNGAANQLEDGLLLDWSAAVNAVSYEYRYAVSEAALALAPGIPTALTQASISGLTLGQSYYWQVRALNGALISDWSDVFAFTVVNVPLAPVMNPILPLEDAFVNSAGFTVGYSQSDGATSYQIFLKIGAGAFAQVGVSNALTFAIVGPFTPGDSLQVKVKAANSAGVSGDSDIRTISVGAAPVVSGDIIIYPSANVAPGLETILWNAIPGATGYVIDISTSLVFDEFTFSINTNSISFTFVLGENYIMRVRAVNQFGASAYSTTHSVACV